MGKQKFLHLENIEKRFPIPGKEDYIAVTDVDIEINKNEIRATTTKDLISLTIFSNL